MNLVSNAIKFTSKGKITVRVHLLSEDEESTTVEFAISDTGIGIEESKIDNIFDNFIDLWYMVLWKEIKKFKNSR